MRHTKLTTIFFALSLFAVSCKSQMQKAQNNAENEGLQLLLSDTYSGDYPEKLLIFRNSGAIKKFFSKINQTRKPGLAVPMVDFDNNMVLVFFGPLGIHGETAEMILESESETQLIFGERKATSIEKDTNSTATGGFFKVYSLPITEKGIVFRN